MTEEFQKPWPVLQPEIETDRMLLRPVVCGDAGDLQRLAGDERVARYTMNIPHPYEDGLALAWIETLHDAWSSRRRVDYAMVLAPRNRFIGVVSLVSIEWPVAEIGYWVGVPYWGQGYCVEAASEMILFGRQALGIQTFTATCVARNTSSVRVLEKLGMTLVRSGRQKDRHANEVDFLFYATSHQ